MITPAKWQAKGGIKNETFRKEIVPYMYSICYYPNCYDVFNIDEADGISYYIIDKDAHNKKLIKVLCKYQKLFNTDFILREIGKHLNTRCISILDKVGDEHKLYVDTSRTPYIRAGQVTTGDKNNYDCIIYSGSSSGEKKIFAYALEQDVANIKLIDGFKVITSFKIGGNNQLDSSGKVTVTNPMKKLGIREGCKDDFMVIFHSYEESKVDSFITYIDTKLCRFLLFCGVVGQNASNSEFWRFVPDPNDWTCTYVDAPHPNVIPDEKGYYTLDGKKYCSLYARYKLTLEEINIIESVIKERKQK